MQNLSILIFFCFCSLGSFSQTSYYTYDTYEEAVEGFKKFGIKKAFKALEAKYDACKHMRSSSLQDTKETMNDFTGRMDIVVKWNFKYVGCYIGYHKYKGTAIAKGYIRKTEDDKYKYGFSGAQVIRYDPAK